LVRNAVEQGWLAVDDDLSPGFRYDRAHQTVRRWRAGDASLRSDSLTWSVDLAMTRVWQSAIHGSC